MSTFSFYRSDKRIFQVGDRIATAGHFEQLNPDGEKLEDLLESHRPSEKPTRTSSLFLFEVLADAEWHWAKMAGGILYRCQAVEEEIRHRGDMRLIDMAGAALRGGEDASAFIERYWAGSSTERPIWELLTKEATISEVICSDQRKRQERLMGRPLLLPLAAGRAGG